MQLAGSNFLHVANPIVEILPEAIEVEALAHPVLFNTHSDLVFPYPSFAYMAPVQREFFSVVFYSMVRRYVQTFDSIKGYACFTPIRPSMDRSSSTSGQWI